MEMTGLSYGELDAMTFVEAADQFAVAATNKSTILATNTVKHHLYFFAITDAMRKENEIIVLYCVGSLTDSPTILRDLELINNRVIVVSLNGVKSRYPTIYSRWCAVGLWAAIVQFGAGCGKESFCPAVDRRLASTPHGHVCFSPRCSTDSFHQHHTRISPGMPPWGILTRTRDNVYAACAGQQHSTCPKTPAAATLCRCPGASKSAIGNSSSSFESRAWGCKSDSPANRLDKSRLFASLRS
ncbi:hypothetical protein PC120_g9017 [Phytophthora cactorum]|nr:hypothetical protein PC120_g9017 [Phytophthora cactorum]